MIPKTLEISGFLSYRKPVKIDFKSFDLACITGDNGAGKSSILDAITWALFGKARKSDDSIINLQSDEAQVTFIFEYENATYRIIRTNPRDGVKRVVLHVKVNDDSDWRELTNKTIRMTDARIEKIFSLDYETFINVSFFLQGKADQFTQQTPGNRKAILTQILGLEIWERYRTETSERRRKLEKDIERIEGQLEEISIDLEDEDAIKERITELKELQEQFAAVALKYNTILTNNKALHESLKSQKRFLKDKQESIEKSKSTLSSSEKRLDTRLDERDISNEILEKKDEIKSQYQEWNTANELLMELEEKRKQYVGVEDSIIFEAKDTANGLQEISDERDTFQKNIDGIDKIILKHPEIIKLDLFIKTHQELLDEGTCPTCQTEINAEDFGEELDDLKDQRDTYAKGLKQGITEDTTMEIAKLDIDKIQFKKDSKARAVKLQAELDAIKFDEDKYIFTKDFVKASKDIQTQHTKLIAAEAKLEPILREIKELGEEMQIMQDQIDKDTEVFEAESVKYEEAEDALPDMKVLQDDYDEAKAQEDEYTQKLGGAEEKLKALQASRKRLSELRKSRADIVEVIANYKRLESAFGKNGIPALLIEQSLPQIENRANEILDRLSAGTMSVRFITQREYKDTKRDDKKETLDIQIQDQAGIRDYEMYSGGESFRINFAIRLALSYVLSQRAGAKIQTLVIDEGFGSQDNIGKERLIEAINIIREDFEKILIITHVEELKEIFPNQIFVEKKIGGSQIMII